LTTRIAATADLHGCAGATLGNVPYVDFRYRPAQPRVVFDL
jgi:hypothetical protein